MSKDNTDRVDETLAYMRSNGINDLPWSIDRCLFDESRNTAGEYIKLSNTFKLGGDKALALQAILLCHYCFIVAKRLGKVDDWGAACFGDKEAVMAHWGRKSSAEINGGIESYSTVSQPGCIAGALESLGRSPSQSDFNYYAMSRNQHKGIGTKAAICYQSICLALWMSGYTSIGWLATWYASSNAGNCFDLLGDGEVVTDIRQIMDLRGTVLSFRNVDKGDATQYVNHWAVIVGGGRAIGSNTDGFSNARRVRWSRGEREFIWGNRNFQMFDIQECFDACSENTKYADAGGVRVAIHRPMEMVLW